MASDVTIARRVPDGARVYIRTHNDKPGNDYAMAIRDSLADRCPLFRSKGGHHE